MLVQYQASEELGSATGTKYTPVRAIAILSGVMAVVLVIGVTTAPLADMNEQSGYDGAGHKGVLAATTAIQGWIAGSYGQSCKEGCEEHGLVCTEGGLRAHNNEVDKPKEVLDKIKLQVGDTGLKECDSASYNAAAEPWWDGNMCYASNPAKTVFNCGQKPNQDAQRLCYCKPRSSVVLGWHSGRKGQSCNEGCEEYGLVCTEDGLRAHNGEVDEPEEVLQKIKLQVGDTGLKECDSASYNAAAEPWWDENYCYLSHHGKTVFSCSQKPNTDAQRLCMCVENEKGP